MIYLILDDSGFAYYHLCVNECALLLCRVCKISWDDTSIEPHVTGEIVHFIDSNDVTQVRSSSFY